MMKEILSKPWVSRYGSLALLLLAVFPSALTAVYYSFHDHWCDYWPTFNYFVGYEYGFGGRKLIGTLLGPLMPEMVTAKHIRLFILPANLLMLFGAVWFVWRSLRGKGHSAAPVAVLLALYAANPFSLFAYVHTHLSMCFMETYMLVLVLAWLMLYVRHRGTWYYYAATLLIPVACCLIHITFCGILLPLMLGLMVFDALDGGRLHTGKTVLYALTLALLALLFILLWYWGGMTVDLDTLYDYIASRANQDVLPTKDGLRMLYYTGNTDASWMAGFSLRFVVELLMLLPLMALLATPWVVAARQTNDRLERWRYRLPVLIVLLLTVPVFFRATDYSRWWVCWTFSLAMLPLAAFATGDKGMERALQSLWNFLKRHWYLPLLLGLYLLQLHNSNRQFFDGMKESAELIDFISSFFK